MWSTREIEGARLATIVKSYRYRKTTATHDIVALMDGFRILDLDALKHNREERVASVSFPPNTS